VNASNSNRFAADSSLASLEFQGRQSLTVQEVAERLSVTHQHIIDLIEEGQIAAINMGGGARRHYRIPVSAYTAFLQARRTV
jgi:excisionase family DNA binding protein